MLYRTVLLFTTLTVLAGAVAAVAVVPRQVNYQGILTDAGGQPLDGQHDLTFALYPDSILSTPRF